MATIKVTVTDTEMKALEYQAVSVQNWADNAILNQARISKEQIIAALVTHCNANDIAIATGENAQVTQAYELGVVKTAALRKEESEAEIANLG